MNMIHKKVSWLHTIAAFILFVIVLTTVTNLSVEITSAKSVDSYETFTYNSGIGLYSEVGRTVYLEDNSRAYTYKSSNPKIVSVDNHGTYLCLAEGTSTISVYKLNNKKKVAEVKVNVLRAKLGCKKATTSPGNKALDSAVIYERYGATYTLKSSNPNIVTHTNYVDLLGVSPGTATVTVYENYKGKSRKLGDIKVTVIPSELAVQSMKISHYQLMESDYVVEIKDKNPKAIYQYKSDNSSIVKVDKDGIFCTKGFGKVKIHVYETYLNKKRKVGALSVEVARAALVSPNKTHELTQDAPRSFDRLIDIEYETEAASYYCKSEDSNMIKIDKEMNIIPVSTGQTRLLIYEKYKGVERLLGTHDINVISKEAAFKGIQFTEDAYEELSTLYVDSEYLDGTCSYVDDLSWYVEGINPEATIPNLIYTSSNEAVIKIVDGYCYQPISEGETDLIISDGGAYTIKMHVTVKRSTSQNMTEDIDE